MGLTVTAPDGAHFTSDEVKTERGTKTLGEVPILAWDDVSKAVAFYGEDGMKDILDGTSLRVSFQNIARRFKAAGKTDDEIANAQVAFRPGKRSGASTPASRAANAARKAGEKIGDSATELLQRIAAGDIGEDEIAALLAAKK